MPYKVSVAQVVPDFADGLERGGERRGRVDGPLVEECGEEVGRGWGGEMEDLEMRK